MPERILIIGDSYGAAGRSNSFFMPSSWLSVLHTDKKTGGPYVCWTDLLQDHYRCAMNICSYAGKSWWFSYRMFERWKSLCTEQWQETDTVIFLHTHWARFNSSNRLVSGHSPMGPSHCEPGEESESRRIWETLKLYELDLYDDEFNHWCQNRFFSMLPGIFAGKRLINLACFEEVVRDTDYANIAVGSMVMQDLAGISFGEFDRRPDQFHDPRVCHLSTDNHHTLVQHLINFIDDYQPGPVQMPLSSFRQGFLDHRDYR